MYVLCFESRFIWCWLVSCCCATGRMCFVSMLASFHAHQVGRFVFSADRTYFVSMLLSSATDRVGWYTILLIECWCSFQCFLHLMLTVSDAFLLGRRYVLYFGSSSDSWYWSCLVLLAYRLYVLCSNAPFIWCKSSRTLCFFTGCTCFLSISLYLILVTESDALLARS